MDVGVKCNENSGQRTVSIVDSKTGRGLTAHYDLEHSCLAWIEKEDFTGQPVMDKLLDASYLQMKIPENEFNKIYRMISGDCSVIYGSDPNLSQFPSLITMFKLNTSNLVQHYMDRIAEEKE